MIHGPTQILMFHLRDFCHEIQWDSLLPLVNFKWVIYQGFRIFGISKNIFCHVIMIMIHMSCDYLSIYPYIHTSIHISTHQSIYIYQNFILWLHCFPLFRTLFPQPKGHGASDLQHPQVPTATGQRSQWTPRLGNVCYAVPLRGSTMDMVKGCIAHVICII